MTSHPCPSCGATNPSGAQFCGTCGEPLTSEIPAPERRTRTWLNTAVVVVVALVAGLVGYTVIGPGFGDGSEVEITADEQAVLEHESGARVDFPAGAVSETRTATVSLTEDPPPADSEVLLVGAVYSFELDGPALFELPVTLTIPYDPTLLPQDRLELEVFVVFWYEEAWHPLYGTVDEEANTVTVQTTHFTLFGGAISNTGEFLTSDERSRLIALAEVPRNLDRAVSAVARADAACEQSAAELAEAVDDYQEITDKLANPIRAVVQLTSGAAADLAVKTALTSTGAKRVTLGVGGKVFAVFSAFTGTIDLVDFTLSSAKAHRLANQNQKDCAEVEEAAYVLYALQNPTLDIRGTRVPHIRNYILSRGIGSYISREVADNFDTPTPPQDIIKFQDLRSAVLHADQSLQTKDVNDWVRLVEPTLPYDQQFEFAQELVQMIEPHEFSCVGILPRRNDLGDTAGLLYKATGGPPPGEHLFFIVVGSPPQDPYYRYLVSTVGFSEWDPDWADRVTDEVPCLPEMTTTADLSEFDSDVRLIVDLWNGYNEAASAGSPALKTYVLANNYPGLSDCSQLEDVGLSPTSVFEGTIRRSDDWTITEGPLQGLTPNGRVYEMSTAELNYLLHATVIDDTAYFFIICGGRVEGGADPRTVDLAPFLPPGTEPMDPIYADLDDDGQEEIILEASAPSELCLGTTGGARWSLVILAYDPVATTWRSVFEQFFLEFGDGGYSTLELIDLDPGPGTQVFWERSALGGCGQNPWKETYVIGWDGNNATTLQYLNYSGGTILKDDHFVVVEYVPWETDPGCCPTAVRVLFYGWAGSGIELLRAEGPMSDADAFEYAQNPEPPSTTTACGGVDPLLDFESEGFVEGLYLNLDLRYGSDYWWLPENWLQPTSNCIYRWSYHPPDGWGVSETTAAAQRLLDQAAAASAHPDDPSCNVSTQSSDFYSPTWICVWGSDSFALLFDGVWGIHFVWQVP